MSFKTCLLVPALLLPACIDPAVQGMTATTGESSGTGPGGATTGSSTGPEPTSDPGNTSIATTDPGASCDDGQLNQDESDVDCGGSCPPCEGAAMCDGDTDCKSGKCEGMKCFPLARSCLELSMLMPTLPSGAYPLDPDGDGANPLDFFCDMEPPNPGWTQVFIDALDPAPIMGVWEPAVTGECGDSGAILGPHGMGGALALAITAQKVPHTELKVVVDAVIMDSWDAVDDDRILIKLDGAEIFTQSCDSMSDFTCGQVMNLCSDPNFNDSVLPIATAPFAHDADPIALEFTSVLNEAVANESWGLDKVVVFVK